MSMLVLPIQPPIYQSTGSLPLNATIGSMAVVLTSPPGAYLFDGSAWNLIAGSGGVGVDSIAGTANQIIASASTGAVTLSTPQDIATTSNVTFGSLILTTPLALNSGGTNASLTANNGGIFYSTASAAAILSGTFTANQVLLSGSSSTPAWSTATYPATTTINQLLYSSSANVIGGITTAASSVLVTDGSGVPSWSSTIPATAGVTSITGTANQIAAPASTGAVTLSLTNGISLGTYQATTPPAGGIFASGAVVIGNNVTPSGISLDVETSSGQTIATVTGYGGLPTFAGRRAAGTQSSPTAPVSGSTLVSLEGWGYDSTNLFSASFFSGAFRAVADENFTASAHGTRLSFFVTPKLSTTAAEQMRLSSNGGLYIGGAVDPVNLLDIGGGIAIGASFAGVRTTQTNGLIVQGNSYFGAYSFASNVTTSVVSVSSNAPKANAGLQSGLVVVSNDASAALEFVIGLYGSATSTLQGAYVECTVPGSNYNPIYLSPNFGGVAIGYTNTVSPPYTPSGLIVAGQSGFGTSSPGTYFFNVTPITANNYSCSIGTNGTLANNATVSVIQAGGSVKNTDSGNHDADYIYCYPNAASGTGGYNNMRGLRIDAGSDASAIVQTGFGIYVASIAYGTSARYGAYFSAPNTSGVTNIYTAYFDPGVSIGSPAANQIIGLRVNAASNANTYYQFVCDGTLVAIDGSNSQIGIGYYGTLSPTLGSSTSSALYITPNVIAPSGKTISAYNGAYFGSNFSSNVGTITNAFSVYIDAGTSATGSLTSNYSLRVLAPAAGVNKYTIYADPGVGIGANINNQVFTFRSNSNSNANTYYNTVIDGTLINTSNGLSNGNTFGIFIDPTLNPATGASVCAGLRVTPSIIAPSSMTIGSSWTAYFSPTYAGNVGTLTNVATVYIDAGSSSSGTGPTINWSLYVAKPVAGSTLITASFAGGINVGSSYVNNLPNADGINCLGNISIATTSSANALDVNGGIGVGTYAGGTSAGSGNVILSGALGVGTSSTTGFALHANPNSSASIYCNMLSDGTLTQTNSGLSSGYQVGVWGNNTFTPTLGASTIYNFYVNATFIAPSTKTITNAYGHYVYTTYSSNVGTINNGYGMYISGGSSASGTLLTNTSLYVQAPAGGSSQYTAYFDAGVGIGTQTSSAGAGNIFAINASTSAQYGIIFTPTVNTSTNPAVGLYLNPILSPGGSVAGAAALYINGTFATSNITNAYSIWIAAGATSALNVTLPVNAYGLRVEMPAYASSLNVCASFGGQTAIGTLTPNASALLDLVSTTQGLGLPAMTTTQKNAISSPRAGLMVFDTTLAKSCVYSGSAWQTITSV